MPGPGDSKPTVEPPSLPQSRGNIDASAGLVPGSGKFWNLALVHALGCTKSGGVGVIPTAV